MKLVEFERRPEIDRVDVVSEKSVTVWLTRTKRLTFDRDDDLYRVTRVVAREWKLSEALASNLVTFWLQLKRQALKDYATGRQQTDRRPRSK